MLQAEALTAHICEVLTGTLERLETKFATKQEGERSTFLQDSAFGLFKAETRTTLEMRQAAVTRDYDSVKAEARGASRSPPALSGSALASRLAT